MATKKKIKKLGVTVPPCCFLCRKDLTLAEKGSVKVVDGPNGDRVPVCVDHPGVSELA